MRKARTQAKQAAKQATGKAVARQQLTNTVRELAPLLAAWDCTLVITKPTIRKVGKINTK